MSKIKLGKQIMHICDYCERSLINFPGGSVGWDKNGFSQPIDFDLCIPCIIKLEKENNH